MLFNILALVSTLIMITLLRRLVNIFPSFIACMARWKENVNLEASVKNSFDRNIIAVGMVIPFCLVSERFNLYDPSFMAGMNENLRIGITSGVFIVYIMIRTLISSALRPSKISRKAYETGVRMSYTFFIILTLLLISIGGIMNLAGVMTETIRSAILWISAFIYIIHLLRKIQIFSSNCSIFTAFLYLCALEIVPTGILMATAMEL